MIERVREHFRAVRMRGDSGYYDQQLVKICAARGVEFFNRRQKARECDEGGACDTGKRLETISAQSVKQRGEERAPAQATAEPEAEDHHCRKPKSWFKGKPEIASMVFRPASWSAPYRSLVIKRTPIIDKDDQQLYLDEHEEVRLLDRGDQRAAQ